MWRKSYGSGKSEITRLFDEIWEIYYQAWKWPGFIYDEMGIYNFRCERCGWRFATTSYWEISRYRCQSCGGPKNNKELSGRRKLIK